MTSENTLSRIGDQFLTAIWQTYISRDSKTHNENKFDECVAKWTTEYVANNKNINSTI